MPDDIKILQGTWNMTSLEIDGAKLPSAAVRNSQIIIDGDHFTAIGMGAIYKGKIVLNPSSSPKTIDMEFTEGPEKGGSSLGIYELDGDKWKLCLTTAKRSRPASFESSPNSGLALETFARSFVAETQPIDISSNIDFTHLSFEPSPEMQGEWSLVTGIRDGFAFDDKMIKSGKRITKGCETIVSFGGQVFMKARVKVDGGKSPREIDYYNTDGAYAGKIQYGIYELNNGVLKVIFSPPENPRPADFTSKPGDSRTLTVWRK